MTTEQQPSAAPSPRRPRPVPPRKQKSSKAWLVPVIILGILGIMFFGFVAMVFFVMMLSTPEPVKVTRSSVLAVQLQGNIVEHQPPDPFQAFMDRVPLQLHDYISMIQKAGRDSNVEGIFLEVGLTSLSWAQAADLKQALDSFKRSGKWIVAYGELWQEMEYYIATSADEIYMPQHAVLNLDGFMARASSYGDLLEKYGVGVHVEAIGEYKSMADSFLYNQITPYNREQTQGILDMSEQVFIDAVSSGRDLEVDVVSETLRLSVFDAGEGLEAKLIDDLFYRDQVNSRLAELMETERVNLVYGHQYWRPNRSAPTGNGVAVIYALGGIQSGQGGRGFLGDPVVGDLGFIEQLKEARRNNRIKAIVIRIDSPGGSVLASDTIWREVRKTVESGKPVIASMGSVAASGGYYIAMACDQIFAQPLTLTGSIGVVSMRWDFANLYDNMLVNVDVMKTQPSADFFDPSRQLSQQEIELFHQRAEGSYRSFVTKAAESRGVSYEALDAVARGRVWTGKDAMDQGLVDRMGSLQDAIQHAAEQAGLQKYSTYRFPKQQEWDLLGLPGITGQATLPAYLRKIIPYELRVLHDILPTDHGLGVHAIAPYVPKIE